MELRDDEGFVGRFDMGYDEFLLLIEYEGEQHLNDKVQWTRDIVREERARVQGYSVVRINAELFRDPWAQVLRIHKELVRGGYRGRNPVRSASWEACFGPLRVRQAA